MQIIPLTQGKFSKVCDCHADLVSQHRWSYHKTHANPLVGYAVTNLKFGPKHNQRHMVSMHRLILGSDAGSCIDHRDGDRLNNQCGNLRPATKRQNGSNRKIHRNNSSGVSGVNWHKRIGKWQAQIRVNWERVYLGYFTNFEDAVAARKAAEKMYFGEFARVIDAS